MRRLPAPAGRLAFGAACAAFGLTGCPDPNFIGIQDYGSIYGTVYDTSNNQPVNNAIVSVGSLIAVHTDPKGHFVLMKVPIGTQTVTIQAVPYVSTTIPVAVVKDQSSSAGAVGLQNALHPGVTPPPGASPVPAEASASPTAAASPAASGTPAGGGSAAPSSSPASASPQPATT